MTTVRHIARAVGVTSSTAPAYRVELCAGAHRLVADESATGGRGGGDAGPSPFGFLVSGRRPSGEPDPSEANEPPEANG